VTALGVVAVIAVIVALLSSFEPPNLHRTTPAEPAAKLVACGYEPIGIEVENPRSSEDVDPGRTRLSVLAATVRLTNPTAYPRTATVTVNFGHDDIEPGMLRTEIPAQGRQDVVIPTGDPKDGEDGHGRCTVRSRFDP
jgi:hypothetical protein